MTQMLQQPQQQVVPIKFIGKKPFKVDNVNHTKTVWKEPGDVQPYPFNLAASLLQHKDVWVLAKATDIARAEVVTDQDRIDAAGKDVKGPETNGDLTKNTAGAATETQAEAAREGPKGATGKSARTLE